MGTVLEKSQNWMMFIYFFIRDGLHSHSWSLGSGLGS